MGSVAPSADDASRSKCSTRVFVLFVSLRSSASSSKRPSAAERLPEILVHFFSVLLVGAVFAIEGVSDEIE